MTRSRLSYLLGIDAVNRAPLPPVTLPYLHFLNAAGCDDFLPEDDELAEYESAELG
jgi:hypothetical protein